jgi:hypothetical protein
MLWTMPLAFPLMAAVQSMCALIGRVTGRGLAANIKEAFPPLILKAVVILLLIANTLNIAADVAAMGEVGELVTGLNRHAMTAVFVFATLGLQILVPYHRYVAYLKWLHGKYGYPAMFAAYNDGPGDLEAFQNGARALPDETRNYVESIARMLKDPAAVMPGAKPVTLTRPDGSEVAFDLAKVTAIRAPVPGEYAPGVRAVISLGRVQLGVREEVAAATTLLRQHGARL